MATKLSVKATVSVASRQRVLNCASITREMSGAEACRCRPQTTATRGVRARFL